MQRILIVEDEENLRNLYTQILEAEHYIVDVALDGETGLLMIRKGGYDLILLDIMLPKIDGLQIMEELGKKGPLTPNGPILFLTNAEARTTIAKGISYPVHGYLIKSDYDPGQLVAEVRRVLNEVKSL